MKAIKKITALFACISFVVSVLAVSAFAEVTVNDYEIPIDSSIETVTPNVLLYCVDRDQYLYAKGAEQSVNVSASVKMMVGAVALELYGDKLDEIVTVTQELLEGAQGYNVGLKKGEKVTYGYLLSAVLMRGANDAATVLARLYNGNLNDFLALMNEKAKACGAENTSYKNVTGLYADGMTTTLYDQIKIAQYAASVEGLLEMTSKDTYVLHQTDELELKTLNNRNGLVRSTTKYKTEGVTGLCYGTTDESGDVLMVSAEIGGMTYFMALYGGTEYENEDDKTLETSVYVDARTLLKYASEGFGFKTVLSTGKPLCEVPVKYNTTVDSVHLVAESEITLYLPTTLDVEKDLKYEITVFKESLDAPVQEGQAEGRVTVYYAGQQLCSADLVTKNPVSRNKILYVIDQIEEFTSSRRFVITVIVFLLIALAYVLITSAVRHAMKKKRRRLR
ncbi:MAG: D-alanyl-D-alanine carboxypeptidase [Clostridia bacterium]|nr:D-alanyl-D-alanine carboxypeptidase [Clostridia bacterium]